MIVKMDKTAQETYFECSDGCVEKQKDRMVSLTSDLQDELNKETVQDKQFVCFPWCILTLHQQYEEYTG